MNIVARWPGSTHDQAIFANSTINHRFMRGDFGNFILIGDSGYANTWYLATPFTMAGNEARDPRKAAYNRSLIPSRNIFERSYGLLKRRFPVLAYGMRVKLSTVQRIIVACAVLHNIAIDAREPMPPQGGEDRENQLNDLPYNDDGDIDDVHIPPENPHHFPQIGGQRRLNAREEILQRFNNIDIA